MTALNALLYVPALYWIAVSFVACRHRLLKTPKDRGTSNRPAISILKPAQSAQENFAENLRSHAAQQYPEFEILVGIHGSDQVASRAIEQVRSEFPKLRIEAITCDEASPGSNPKVAVLERLAEHASQAVWVVSDADIEVPAGYLDGLQDSLAKPGVGLVTCLFHARPSRGLPSLLEALWINSEFMGQILLARAVQSMKFAIGATVAFHRDTLDKIGGFRTLRNYIGDDYVLGEEIDRAGYRVSLCSIPVTTHLPNYSFRRLWRHQLRWSRTIRSQRPGGHVGLVVTNATVWAVAAAILASSDALTVSATIICARVLAQIFMPATASTTSFLQHLLLFPLLDLLAFSIWLASFFSNEVTWAGKKYRLGPKGKILS